MTKKQKAMGRPFPGQLSRAVHLFALVQLAVAWPVYDLLSRYPEFFVARQSQPGDIVLLVVALSACLAAVLFGLQAAAAQISPRLGRAFHALVMALLFLLLGLSIAHQLWDGPAQLTFGLLFCLLMSTAYLGTAAGRLFLTFLSPAIIVVPLMFLLNKDVASLLQPEDMINLDGQSDVAAITPLLFIVFDEFPTYALLDESGGIDAERFPNFHALAETAHWFPNATTVAASTILAVPPILTGRYPAEFVMPHHGEFPDNLFTWLGPDYDLNVHESVSVMCPPRLCGSGRVPPTAERLNSLLLDVSAIYLNIVTPDHLQTRLPVVTQSWERFWGGMQPGQRMYEHRLRQLENFTGQIVAGAKPGLDFIHANFPHIPYEYLPSGKRYQEGWLMPGLDVPRDAWAGTEWQSVEAYRRLLLQIAALDQWLGNLIGRLKSEGLFDRSLIVITADHGVSFTPGWGRREAPPPENLDKNILPVPLLIKAPGQQEGVKSARNAETVDIIPTLADLLDRPLTWQVDGASLLGEPKSPGKRAWYKYKEFREYSTNVEQVAAALRLAGQSGLFPGYEGKRHARRMAGFRLWIGDEIAKFTVRSNAELVIEVDHAAFFRSVALDSDFLPAFINGSVDWPGREAVDLAIALNGRLAAFTTAYVEDEGLKFSALLPESLFRDGENLIRVFGLETGDSGQVVLINGATPDDLGDYSWNPDYGVLTPAGERLTIDQDGVAGAVDYISLGDESAEILGWAIDVTFSRTVKDILVFDGSRLVYRGRTPMLREETHQFGVVVETGFLAVIPLNQLQDRSGGDLRVFAVTADGRVLEISP